MGKVYDVCFQEDSRNIRYLIMDSGQRLPPDANVLLAAVQLLRITRHGPASKRVNIL
jgi:hypothetical protein